MASEVEVERLVVRLLGDGAKYQKMLLDAEMATKKTTRAVDKSVSKLERMQAKLNAVGAGFKRAGQKMRGIGMGMALRITAPIALIGGVATKAFANFDQAMIESTSIMKVTEAQIDSMRKTALNLSESGQLLQGPRDLAKSYFFLASAGKNAEQSMALLPAVSKFATAGAFDMALATDLLTDAQSALGLSSKDAAQDALSLVRVSDVLVKANTLANASVQQFSTALTSKAGAALKSYNKDVEEGVAVLAAMADQGIKAELAGNALDRITRLLGKSTLDNSKAHKKFGFEVFDAAGKMRNFADVIKNLEDILGGMSDQMKVSTLDALGFEARVQGVILPLLGTSEAIRVYEAELRKAGKTTEIVAGKQMESFSNQMKVVKNQLMGVAIDIGQILAPMLLKLNTILKAGVSWWKKLSPGVKRLIVVFGLAAAAIGPMLIALASLAAFIGFVITGVSGIMVGLGAAIAFLSAPIGIVLAALTAIAALIAAITAGVGLFFSNGKLDITVKKEKEETPEEKRIAKAAKAGERSFGRSAIEPMIQDQMGKYADIFSEQERRIMAKEFLGVTAMDNQIAILQGAFSSLTDVVKPATDAIQETLTNHKLMLQETGRISRNGTMGMDAEQVNGRLVPRAFEASRTYRPGKLNLDSIPKVPIATPKEKPGYSYLGMPLPIPDMRGLGPRDAKTDPSANLQELAADLVTGKQGSNDILNVLQGIAGLLRDQAEDQENKPTIEISEAELN